MADQPILPFPDVSQENSVIPRRRKNGAAARLRANQKKAQLLGMPAGTASARLLKIILYSLVVRVDEHRCYRCSRLIERVEDMSIEHKRAWQIAEDPVHAFFDLKNISFSHRKCNYAAASKPMKKFASKQHRIAAYRPHDAARKRRDYTKARRRQKYLTTGH